MPIVFIDVIVKRLQFIFLNDLSSFLVGQGRERKAKKFEETRGFPGLMGAIDGKAPRKNPEQYINRKGYHSIDTTMRFRDVFCGFPGSVHDARLFRNSPFFMDAEEHPQQLAILN